MSSSSGKSRGPAFLILVGSISAAAAGLLDRGPLPAAPGDGFQRATGGIGLSAAASPSWCFFALDPRIESSCENEFWPIPGLPCYCPHHGAAVADLPPLEPSPRR